MLRLFIVFGAVAVCGCRASISSAPSIRRDTSPMVALGVDSAHLLRVLGEPAARLTAFNAHSLSDTGRLVFSYEGAHFELDSVGRVAMASVRGSRWRTDRGLRIGADSTRVLSLYGEPTVRLFREGPWGYDTPATSSHLVVYLDGGLVTGFIVSIDRARPPANDAW